MNIKEKKMLLLLGNANFWCSLTLILLLKLLKMDILDLRIKLTSSLSQHAKVMNFNYGYISLYVVTEYPVLCCHVC